MFRGFYNAPITSAAKAPKKTFVKRVAQRMPVPDAAPSADGSNQTACITVDGGQVTKLIVECNPSSAESVCEFYISNSHGPMSANM
jgi:hypothetical protein